MRGLEHFLGVDSVGTEFGELGHDFGTVFGIRHAEPLGSGVEYLASGLSLSGEGGGPGGGARRWGWRFPVFLFLEIRR